MGGRRRGDGGRAHAGVGLVSGFSDAWLALREPADHAARSRRLVDAIARQLDRSQELIDERRPLTVLDLATGTGSNPRYLMPKLSAWQDWRLLDADIALLAALPSRMAVWATRIGCACTQTAEGIALSGLEWHSRLRPWQHDLTTLTREARLSPPALVTASALLDLVSDEWLQSLVTWCSDGRSTALFALSYDGTTTLTPHDEDDDLVLQLVNRHQVTDKGFGVALGPAAIGRTDELFQACGYVVERERTDWVLGSGSGRLQGELIAGWASAARELAPAMAARIDAWEARRHEASLCGTLAITVGHEDLAAWPAR